MNWFLFSPFSINVLNVFLLLAFMIYFLLRSKGKSKATLFLVLSLIGVELVFLSFFVIFSSLNSYYATLAWWLLHLMVFGAIAMVQFAYYFPENLYHRESKVALIVCTVISCLIYPYYISKTLSMEPTYIFEGYSYIFLNTPEIGIIIGLEILWILTIFFRKAALFSDFQYRGFMTRHIGESEHPSLVQHVSRVCARFFISCIRIYKAKDKRAKALRSLFLLFISPVVLISSIVMAYEGIMSWEISAHILGTGFMVVAFLFVIVYINSSSEPSTFMVKLIGISLGTILIVFGLGANIAVMVKDDAYNKRRLMDVNQCKRAVHQNDFSALPGSVVHILTRPSETELQSGNFETIFSRHPSTSAVTWFEDAERISEKYDSDIRTPAEGEVLRRYLEVNAPDKAYFFVHYDFVINGKIYEVGFDYFDYRMAIHETACKLVLVTLGSAFFIMIVFPFFFRESLVKPLDALLEGVRKVNTGDLQVTVPIQVEDEIGFISGSFNNMVVSVRDARHELENALDHQVKLTDSYSCFVPKEFLKFLGKETIIDIKLGDNVQKEMTILFSDIRSFTSLSEKMTPQENFNFINSCLSRIGPVVRQNRGFIDKYIGDAIMALFPYKPKEAIKAAIGMQSVIGSYNDHRKKSGYDSIRIGIGIHTGVLIFGTIGEKKRMEGTVISDAVNLASRVESLTKLYGSLIIVSGKTLDNLDNPSEFTYRFLDRVQVKGKKKYVDIFEIFDSDSESQRDMKLKTKKDFEKGISLYQNKDFKEALRFFNRVIELNDNDMAARLYAKRCQDFELYGSPDGWEGITTLDHK